MESLVDIANETAAQRVVLSSRCQADTLSVCQLICHTDCQTACPFFSEEAAAAAAAAAVAAPKRLARHRSMGV